MERTAVTRDADGPAQPGGATGSVTGIDGCPGGWVAVTLTGAGGADRTGNGGGNSDGDDGQADRAAPETVRVAVAPTLTGLGLATPFGASGAVGPSGLAAVGIDMPLGLLARGWRDADRLARRQLGRRGVTVFMIAPRPVWLAGSYAEANRMCRELTGQGLSAQAWGLRGKLIEADAYRRGSAVPLYEVHPELAFAALAGAPLPVSKHTAAGLAVRRELLGRAGITAPARVAGAAENDLLDAAAVAWSARRIAAGQAVTLTSDAQRADDGTEIAIRY